jgi:hypothetical protein
LRRTRAKRGLNLDLNLRRHVAGEMQEYEAGELKAFVGNGVASAVANARDPRRVGEELAAVTAKITASAPRLGLGPEATAAAVGAARTQIHVGVIGRLLDTGDDQKAAFYYHGDKDTPGAMAQIDGKARGDIEKALEAGWLRGESQRVSDVILAAGGSLDEQRAKVRAIENPKLRDAVQDRVEHEAVVADRVAREAEEADASEATNLIEKSGRFDAIPPSLLARLPLGLRGSLRSYARAKAAGVPVETDLPTYYSLMTKAGTEPEAFVTENLLKYRGKLDEPEFKQLASLQLALRNGERNKVDKDLAGFRTKSDILEDSLVQYGIDPKAKAGTADANAIAQLRRMLDRRVEADQAGGVKVDNVTIQAHLDALLGQETTIPGSWWNIWPGGKSFTDTKGSLLKTPASAIPEADRKVYEQVLAESGHEVTPATVLDLHLEILARRKKK